MRSVWCLASLALGVALAGRASRADAQLVLAQPIVGKTVMAPADNIQRAIVEELQREGIRPVELTSKLLKALEKCKNKMSCLATAGKAAGATHVLHTIMAERDGQVLTQLTLLSVDSKKPADTLRAKTGPEYVAIERGVRQAAREAVQALLAAEDFPKPKAPPVVAPPAPSLPPVAARPQIELEQPVAAINPPGGSGSTPAIAPPSPSPSPSPSASPSAPIASRAPPVARQLPSPSGKAAPMRIAASREGAGTNFVGIGIMSAGAAAAIAGGVFLGLAGSDASTRDETPQVFVDERASLNDSAFQKQTIGLGLLIGGAGVLFLGTVFLLTGVGASDGAAGDASDPNALVQFTPTIDGFSVKF